MIQTPNQGVPFTHRIMLIASAEDANVEGWNAERPRAKAEPRLEAWAASRLGGAANVVVFAAADGTLTTLDGAGLAALDVVYESANLARLEQAIRAAIPEFQRRPADVGERRRLADRCQVVFRDL